MKDFLKPSASVLEKAKGSIAKIDVFIELLNGRIKQNVYNGDGTVTMNTGLTDIPELNDPEFAVAKRKAAVMNWELSFYEDEYNTLTYKLKPIV